MGFAYGGGGATGRSQIVLCRSEKRTGHFFLSAQRIIKVENKYTTYAKETYPEDHRIIISAIYKHKLSLNS